MDGMNRMEKRSPTFHLHPGTQEEGFRRIVMYRGAAMVPRLREFSAHKRITLMEEASDISFYHPLHLPPFDKKQYIVPSWGQEPLTGGQVVAILVFGMWVHVGEQEDLAAPLVAGWPEILDAKKLGYLHDQ